MLTYTDSPNPQNHSVKYYHNSNLQIRNLKYKELRQRPKSQQVTAGF